LTRRRRAHSAPPSVRHLWRERCAKHFLRAAGSSTRRASASPGIQQAAAGPTAEAANLQRGSPKALATPCAGHRPNGDLRTLGHPVRGTSCSRASTSNVRVHHIPLDGVRTGWGRGVPRAGRGSPRYPIRRAPQALLAEAMPGSNVVRAPVLAVGEHRHSRFRRALTARTRRACCALRRSGRQRTPARRQVAWRALRVRHANVNGRSCSDGALITSGWHALVRVSRRPRGPSAGDRSTASGEGQRAAGKGRSGGCAQ
jgi:hypothetical protein